MNNAGTLPACILSVQNQLQSIEHLVIDGASQDNTLAMVEGVKHPSLRFTSESDEGIYDALNKGIKLAVGDIIGTLQSDDIYSDQQVLEYVLGIFADPSVDAVYGDLEYVDRKDTNKVVRRWIAGEYSPRRFYQGWMPPHPTFFVRRECYEKHGLYRLDLGTAADYELMLRFLLVHQIRIKYIPRVLVKMRVGGASNASLSARWRANRMDRKAWEVNGLKPYRWTLVAKPLRKLPQWWVR